MYLYNGSRHRETANIRAQENVSPSHNIVIRQVPVCEVSKCVKTRRLPLNEGTQVPQAAVRSSRGSARRGTASLDCCPACPAAQRSSTPAPATQEYIIPSYWTSVAQGDIIVEAMFCFYSFGSGSTLSGSEILNEIYL